MELFVTTQPLGSQKDFRLYLQNELALRKSKNAHYSLRSFAKLLDINNAALSLILRGKRPLTRQMIERLGQRLGLAPDKMNEFVPTAKSEPRSETEIKDELELQQLKLDTFICISEWYHDAIMELIKLNDFMPDKVWVAHTLGISVMDVTLAVERLERLGILRITDAGDWIDNQDNNTTIIHDSFTNSALRNLQKKILEMGIEALETCPIEKRDQTSLTLAIQQEDIKEVKSLIRQFRRKLSAYVQREGTSPDDVYHFALTLYPVTKEERR